MLEMFEYWNVEALEFVDLGEHVVVSVCQYARGRGSGVTLESKSAWLFTMRDGKAVRLALLPRQGEAIARGRGSEPAPVDDRVLAADRLRHAADLPETESLVQVAARVGFEHQVEHHGVESPALCLL